MLIYLGVPILIAFSAMFSGLNVGLLSLSKKDLERKAKLGDKRAIKILPLRKKTHLSLASILLSNVAVISATSLLLESVLNGVLAGLVSTLLIVVFGEVLPQAVFAKFALSFCAFLAPLLKVIIIITYPISKPLQLLLDVVVGTKTDAMQTRGELGMIITEHLDSPLSELDDDEVEIMKNALNLSERRVESIITPIRQVFSLRSKDIVDDSLINKIKKVNYSRIPVLTDSGKTCRGVLLMKDLVDYKVLPGTKAGDLPLHSCSSVGSRTALDTMFRKFIAAKTHMLLVTKRKKIIGIVTIEDMLEAIIGHEIEDEYDRKRQRLVGQ